MYNKSASGTIILYTKNDKIKVYTKQLVLSFSKERNVMKNVLQIISSLGMGGITVLLLPFNTFSDIVVGTVATGITYVVSGRIIENVSDQDAKFIRDSLKEAERKNNLIKVYGRKLKMWKLWKQIKYIRSLNMKIIDTIKEHPERFPQADKFFSLYLDSTLNVLDKYETLLYQPMKSSNITDSIIKLDFMLEDVVSGLEQELTEVLKEDIIQIDIEQEVLDKHNSKK